MDAVTLPAPLSRFQFGQSQTLTTGMRVGLFGGSFNPPHDGHWHVAHTAMQRLGLHRVWWVVSPQNPLKSRQETAEYDGRFAAVQALIGRRPGHVVSDIERRLGLERTVHTLAHLTTRWPGVRFVWIMGGDSWATFHRWAAWPQIIRRVPIFVVARPPDGARACLGKAAQRFAVARYARSNPPGLFASAPPAWIYCVLRFNSASSTALRTARIGRPALGEPKAP